MTQKLYSTPIDACTAAGVEYPSRGLLPGPWNVSKAFDGKRWKQGAGRVRMFSDGTAGCGLCVAVASAGGACG